MIYSKGFCHLIRERRKIDDKQSVTDLLKKGGCLCFA